MDRSKTLRKNHRIMHGTCIRAVLVCVLSCGTLFTVVSSFLPGLAIAAPVRKTTSSVITHAQPASGSKSSSPMKASPAHKSSNNQPHAALPVGPDLALSLTANASSYSVGEAVTYSLSITNNSAAAPILAGVPINVTDVLPLGLTNIAAIVLPGQWNTSLTATTSPTTLAATYTGPEPINPGESLPPITLVGILTADALGAFSHTAFVSVPGDANITDNVMTLSIFVSPIAPPTATLTVVVPIVTITVEPTAVSTIEPTAISTVEPTAVSTVEPTAVSTIEPTAVSTPIAPDLSITQSFGSGTPMQVGQLVTITLTVNNSGSAGPLTQGNSILINDILPLGLDQISISGNNWFAFVTSSTGPALLSAVYTNSGAIDPGGALPVLTVTGTLDANILPNLVNTASVSTSSDANATNNVSVDSVSVIPALAPDLNILQTVLGQGVNNKVAAGQSVTITLAITNSTSAGPLARANSVSMYDVLPSGLSHIVVTGNNWFALLTSTSGPSLLSAVYSSSSPLLAGQSMPLLTIRGIVDANAGGTTLANTASVSVPGDGNTSNNTTTTTFYVSVTGTPTVPVTGTPTVPVTGTPTVPVTGTPTVTTPVVSPSASAFILPGVKRV